MGTAKTLRNNARRKLKYLCKVWEENNLKPQCVYCGTSTFTDNNKLTVDHIIPIAKGGTSKHSNLVPCCFECNNKKRNSIWQIKFGKVLDK